MRTFDGFWPALITPYTEDDCINTPMVRALVDALPPSPPKDAPPKALPWAVTTPTAATLDQRTHR